MCKNPEYTASILEEIEHRRQEKRNNEVDLLHDAINRVGNEKISDRILKENDFKRRWWLLHTLLKEEFGILEVSRYDKFNVSIPYSEYKDKCIELIASNLNQSHSEDDDGATSDIAEETQEEKDSKTVSTSDVELIEEKPQINYKIVVDDNGGECMVDTTDNGINWDELKGNGKSFYKLLAGCMPDRDQMEGLLEHTARYEKFKFLDQMDEANKHLAEAVEYFKDNIA